MITLAIPNYNRSDYVIESFIKVLSDERISEILINDDHSNMVIYNDLVSKASNLSSKIVIHRNEKNLGSFLNKLKCVERSKNEWIILLDSDNDISIQYLDSLNGLRDEKTIYAPSHAMCSSPLLDYTIYSNTVLNKSLYINKVTSGRTIPWDCILNTGNYFFNKNTYLNCVSLESEIIESYAADAYYLIYLWFKNIDDAKFHIVEGLRYNHRLGNNSHWVSQSNNSNHVVNTIVNKVKQWT
jgi:hypothetical protein